MHIFYFTLISLFWGGSFLAIGMAVDHFPPAFSAFLRSVIGMTGILFYLFWKKKSLRSAVWLQSMGCGLFTMGIAWIFVFWGEKYVAPALACVLNAAVPIFAVLLIPLMTPNDRLTRNKILGVLIGFVGVLLIFQPGLSSGMTLETKGLAAVLMMSLCYAIGVLWTRRISQRISGAVILFYQCLGSALALFCFTLVFELPYQPLRWSLEGFLAVLYLGIFSTAIAWVLFFKIL
ncbi:MAG: DMT family transporter, partial [Deltaproteobacteria bacterium]|nr:DMT family transporter [Deltaproteobacteria bacterium]